MLTGKRIRSTREDVDMLQQELADAVKINVSVLSRIEKGERPVRDDELVKFADKLHVTADYLLGRTDDSRPLEVILATSATPTSALTPQDQQLLHKYHELDARGKQAILDTLEREHSYIVPKVKDMAT